jgi:hypothetical protein
MRDETQTLSELIDSEVFYAADPETKFDRFKEEFAKADERTRIDLLQYWDRLLDNQPIRPSREDAALMQKVREVRGIHQMLQRIGK